MASTRRDDLLRALPYARRYARALTGSQPRGDLLVAESLREMLASTDDTLTPRYGLYHWVTRRFDAGISTLPSLVDGLNSKQRQLLLLTALEEVPIEDAAPIVTLDLADAVTQLGDARERLRASAATDVLIIEDEPIIAMDIEELVQGCGHRVVGVASTEADAVRLAQATKPGLILADINLGLGGDGTSAVSRILKHHYAPVIFVTAYPERLLTGEAVEPAFVITKPFEPLTLAIATYQAVSGGVDLQ
ncbi:response regulator [Lichenicola cladoniae]|uniref:Response regulator n=1 Tax=Lichenicola cladoniae TaxID=1484109 RepID=A0A6M8HND6_9PROT|nr:response regulator [Lichenicola cladoniae]NPD67383.1 response regulator [Acetobacteraceae bacterium]QKE89878.1 response regulator [Lichenicola cladoniae]